MACACGVTRLWSEDGCCVHPSHAHGCCVLRWRYRLRSYILSFDDAQNDASHGEGADDSDDEHTHTPRDTPTTDRTPGSPSADRGALRRVLAWVHARLAWFVLVAAIFAVSSAATVFKFLDDVGLFTKGAWRLLSTSFILLPGFVYQAYGAPARVRRRLFALRTVLTHFAGGIVLSLHFATWLYSLEHTSLPHSLLLVCMHPVLIVTAMVLVGLPVSKWEIIGTALSFGGTVVLMRDVEADGEVTLGGDLMALLGALFMIVYLCVGRVLRSWMPIFVYAFPVTFWAGVCLAAMAVAVDGVRVFGAGSGAIFGFFAPQYFKYVAYLAFGPGLVGHTGLNYAIPHVGPLVVSLALLTEPLVGSIIGYIAGQSGLPHMWTYIGGPFVLLGLLLASLPPSKKDAKGAGTSGNRSYARLATGDDGESHPQGDVNGDAGDVHAVRHSDADAMSLHDAGHETLELRTFE